MSHKSVDNRSTPNSRSRRSVKSGLFSKMRLIPLTKSYLNALEKPRSPSVLNGKQSVSPSKKYRLSRCHSNMGIPRQKSISVSLHSHLPSSNPSDQLLAKIKEKLKSPPSDPSSQFFIVQELLQNIIDSDKLCSPSLSLIKKAYSQIFDTLSTNLTRLIGEKENLEDESKSTGKKFEKLSKENYQLSKTIEKLEVEYNKLHKKLVEISKVKVDFPKDEEAWKFLISENEAYAETCDALKQDIGIYQYKEEQLLKLFQLLRDKGFPVEEVYANEVAPEVDSESYRDDTDSELIVNSSRKDSVKPKSVPDLKLDKIRFEESSDDSSEPENIK